MTLQIDVHDGADVLLRVLATLRRRRCDITGVDYVARDRHHPGRMVIAIEAPSAHAHCVETWLGNLVDVAAVNVVSDIGNRRHLPKTPNPTASSAALAGRRARERGPRARGAGRGR